VEWPHPGMRPFSSTTFVSGVFPRGAENLPAEI
jgi:hypothetical protein